MKHLIGGLLALSLLSCKNPASTDMDASTHYKKEMIVVVDGVAREGVITMPLKEEGSKIKVIAKGDLNLMVVESCQGIDAQRNAWNIVEEVPRGPFGWFKKTIEKKRESEFFYKAEGIAKSSDCEIAIRGYSESNVHSEGLIGFQTDEYMLQGDLICNKVKRSFDGFEICQSGKGLIQEVHFKEEVKVASSEECSLDKSFGKSFIFDMPLGDCLFTFKGKDTGLLGRLRTYGFSAIAMEVE